MSYLIYSPETPEEKIYQLQSGVNSIGRAYDNLILIDHPSVSRYHAWVEVNTNKFIVKDLGSRNSTFVNDVKVEQAPLQDGDKVRFGSQEFVFNLSAEEKEFETMTPSQNIREEVEKSELFRKERSIEKTEFNFNNVFGDPSVTSVIKFKEKNIYQRTLDKLKVLLEVSRQLSSPQSLEQLFKNILELLFNIIHVDRAAILLFNKQTKQLECQAFKTKIPIQDDEVFYSTQITNWVYSKGKVLATADAARDERFQDSQSIFVQQIHASMCIPLKPKEELIGVLYLDNLDLWGMYSDEDIEFVSALANQAAIAIENIRLYQKIESEAVLRSKLELFFPQSVRKKLQETDKLEIVERDVTILFADISGFTEMSSQKKPREVIEILNEYFTVVVEDIIFKYEATLEKYIGDALLAVWGAPYQKPDDADKALQSAIEMQQAVRRLNQRWCQERNLEIKIHIGLNSGKVAAGNIGSEKLIQYATIGDTTNVCSRICNVAKAEQIVISETTLGRLSNLNLPVTPLPLVKVKGKAKPLQLYLVHWSD
jgi:class 3 adenylate cyclase/pSer/pThr/pTyr-binding forkhead associated (FHA) protein